MRSRQTYGELVADKIERIPDALGIALDNIARWRSAGHSAPHRLAEWETLLVAAQQGQPGLRRLLDVLRGRDAASKRLRDFSPFAGILTREERRQAQELCGYRH